MPAPSFVSTGAASSTAFGSSLTPALPGSRTNGNLLLLFAWGTIAPTGLNTSIASGWTKLGDFLTASGSDWVGIWWRIIDGSEAAPTISLGANSSWATVIHQYTNIYAAAPFTDTYIDAARTARDTSSPFDLAGFLPTRANSLGIVHLLSQSGATAPSLPTSYTSDFLEENTTASNRGGSVRHCSYAFVDENTATPDISTTFTTSCSGFRFELVSEAAPAIEPGSEDFDTPGADTFTVPPYHTLVVEVWGAGASGTAYDDNGAPTHGNAGTSSSVTELSLTAGGGQPGSGSRLRSSVAGAGGTATGGDLNLPGGQATDGNLVSGGGSFPTYVAKGGDAPFGGAGGVNAASTTGDHNGSNGTAPGGGGSPAVKGMFALALEGYAAQFGPGGSSGGYVKKTYVYEVTAGAPEWNDILNLSVGTGGALVDEASVDSGAGANGRVRFSWYDEATAPEEPDPLDNDGVGTGEISGTAQVRKQLTALFNDDDPDGYASDLTYQWLRGATPITGATGQHYTATAADVGSTLSVQVSYTDGEGFRETITVGPTSAVLPPPLPLDYMINGEIWACYGLRQLRTLYTGPLFQVRAQFTGATLDVSPQADGTVDFEAILTWLDGQGAFEGTITKWYDQNGTPARDLLGTLATVSNQPMLVDDSTVFTLPNGHPAFNFNGNQEFKINTIAGPANVLGFLAVVQRNGDQPGNVFQWNYSGSAPTQNAAFFLSTSADQDWQDNAAVFIGNGTVAGRSPRLVSNLSEPAANTDAVIWDGELSALRNGLRRNGKSQAKFIDEHSSYTQPPATGGAFVVGPRPFVTGLTAKMVELVIFQKDVRQAVGEYRASCAEDFLFGSVDDNPLDDLNVDFSDDDGLTIIAVIDQQLTVPFSDDNGLTVTLSLVTAYVAYFQDDNGLDAEPTLTIQERPVPSQMPVLVFSL